MDSIEGNNHGNCTEDESVEHSFSPEDLVTNGIDGDPDILPRVGEEYQVELPPAMEASDYLCRLENQTDTETKDHSSYKFLIGFPIPVTWVNGEVDCKKEEPYVGFNDVVDMPHKKESKRFEHVSKSRFPGKGSLKCKVEPMDVESDQDMAMHKKAKNQCGCPVPGTSSVCWSGIEEASFLLGLYIFGKDLVLLTKFVGSKQMGDILSFYYGTFYKSKSYMRWSECKKMRSRKCIFGERIFTGSRHQELLSRLRPHLSEECQNTLLEVSKTFEEGTISLEEYVFLLKSRVGSSALVEAMAIGKGKQDITGVSMDTPKSTRAISTRIEVPVGKACSALSPLEIVSYLTGNFRLSKARSNDLFWEAVWPRLLARGWHSEQPNPGHFSTASKHSLVFLLPGIKKFSRRKLVKGSHYFDSISDVLSKVASDPELLELETRADKESPSKNENGWARENKPEEEGLPSQQRHCYLKPRTPSRVTVRTDTTKFTVVDTSLASRKTCKVRKLRSLPFELDTSIPIPSSDSEDEDEDASDESTEVSNSADTLCSHRNEVNVSKKTIKANLGREEREDGMHSEYAASERQAIGPVDKIVAIGIPKEQKNFDIFEYMMPRRAKKLQKSQKVVIENKTDMSPVPRKRQRLAACSSKKRSTSNHSSQGVMLQNEVCNFGHTLEIGKEKLSAAIPSPERLIKLSSTSATSRVGSPVMSSEALFGSNNIGGGQSLRWPQFDLNEEPIDVETDEPMIERQHDRTTPEPDGLHSAETAASMAASEQPHALNPRRQSTRNRPLTAKALEAFACGFLDTKQTRKSSSNVLPREKSRRNRGRVRFPDSFDTSVVDYSMQETSTVVHDSSSADGYNELDLVSQTG